VTAEQQAILTAAVPLIQERLVVLSEVVPMIGFLFKTADEIVVEDDAKAGLPENTKAILQAGIAALEPISVDAFNTEPIQSALQAALIEGLGEKPRNAFGPLRTAISGRRISPPLFESMEILGKAETIARLQSFAEAQ
jgi:glutamyl-tRNA synthetase